MKTAEIKKILERYNDKDIISLYYGSIAKDILLSTFETNDFPNAHDNETLCFDRVSNDICKIIATYSKGSKINESNLLVCSEEIEKFLLNVDTLLAESD